uniref:non-contractile tail sheath protein n=1 Tax=Sphingomonas citricola TaxID=2862498 RepID=UPI00358DC681
MRTGFHLHAARGAQASDVMSRFDPVFWTVNFPRPMMAAVTTTAPDALRVDAVFYARDDLAGLIWESVDTHDHPLLAYETARDYRDCRWSFRWRSGGVMPLDAVNGPVLTIEGRDAAGVPRSWYVRLWNYASGTPENAVVAIDFATLDGGFLWPGEADPVWAGDVDRMFVSLVAPGYDAGGGALPNAQEGWVELSHIACEGAGSVIAIGDAVRGRTRCRRSTTWRSRSRWGARRRCRPRSRPTWSRGRAGTRCAARAGTARGRPMM